MIGSVHIHLNFNIVRSIAFRLFFLFYSIHLREKKAPLYIDPKSYCGNIPVSCRHFGIELDLME